MKFPLESQPPDVLHILGIEQLEQDHIDAAVACFEAAVAGDPDNPRYHCNLALALQRLGDPERAIENYRTALGLRPNYSLAHYNFGCLLFELRRFDEALEQFDASLASASDRTATLFTARADALRELGRLRQARRAYDEALAINADHVPAHINLTPLLLNFGELDLALHHCRRAIALEPRNGLALMNLGVCLVGRENYDEAMTAYADALESMPDSAQLCCNIANVWLTVADYPQAERWFERALEHEPEHLDSRIGLTTLREETGDRDEAIAEFRRIVDQHPGNFPAWMGLGKTLWNSGLIDDALEAYQEAARLQPQMAGVHVAIGQLLASVGALGEAEAAYHRALALNPWCVPAFNGLATTLRGRMPTKEVKQIERLLTPPGLREGAQASLHNGLAHYYDGIGQPDKAAEHAAEANRLYWHHKQQRGWEYDPVEHERQIDRIIATFDADFFTRTRRLGSLSEKPVFVVGMPRSGTTLTEQILASHPDVQGVGERDLASRSLAALPMALQRGGIDPIDCLDHLDTAAVRRCADWHLAWLERLADQMGGTQAPRIVDKMPDNYSLLGWIVTLFPHARIIHCRRDPRDVALSCWLTQFSAIRWACHQQHIAERLRQYRRIMDHWRNTLPVPMLELDYEMLVANQEGESRRLIEWLGLDWDPACLAFHHGERLVRTASVMQVRQPLYRHSVARWKPYERHLASLLAVLHDAKLV